MDYDNICYKNIFLNQVIVRIDFLEFIPNELIFSDSLMRAIQEHYPKKGMRQIVRFQDVNVILEPKSSKTEQNITEGFQQEFSNAKNNKFVISNKYVIFDTYKYTSFDNMLETIESILKTIMGLSNLTASRTGIRYINIYEAGAVKLSRNLFNSPIGSMLNTALLGEDEGLRCIRSMAMTEYKYGDQVVNFRYGMYNPEYPRPMRRNSFVLDYDAFSEEPMTGFEAILSHIIDGHRAIQQLFENSVSYKLKQIMGVENND